MKKDSHKNNQTTIFMVCDQNYDFVLANMIIGLKRYNEKLIDKIYVMYDGIPNETLEKIQSIWYGKIIFQRYTDEDFNKDIDNNEFIKDHEFTKKYKKFTYAKWYIFNILEKANTDTVVFLDVDMLVVDTLEELINQNVDFLAAYPGKRKGSLGYFESIEKIGLEEKILYRSGGLYCYNKSIFDKTPTKLTKKCFEILVSYYGKNKLTANYDELIFGIVNTLYNFSFKDSRSFGYNCVFGYDNLENIEPKILHAVAHTKFWKHPASFYIFNEWYGNHKIWVKVYGGEDKISIPPLPIKKLNSVAGLWRFLDTFNHTLNCIEYINSKNISYKLSFSCYNVVINLSNIDIFINYKEPWSRPFVLIRNKFISKEINKIALKYNFIVKKQSIEKIYPLHEFAIFINEFKEIITQFQEKNIIKNKTIEKISLFSKEDKNFKAQNLNLAVARVQNQLSYKLGQAMIVNSKSLLGYIRMPFVLSYIKDKHKQEQKIYQEKIKKDPSLKLPPLENYPNYQEALKEKECFTYKLGEALIKANKTWYKGGYIRLMFEVGKLKKKFKKK